MNMLVLNQCGRVMQEVSESVAKHGDWSDYTIPQMLQAIKQELVEVDEADRRKDVTGPHGLIRELEQVAATCVKACVQLRARS